MPISRKLFDEIRLQMEVYYFLKHMNIEDLLPKIEPPIPPGPYANARGGLVGYTPHPDDPDPWPWPWPWPWWHRMFEGRFDSILNSRIADIGRALGDPEPQTNLQAMVNDRKTHLEAAEAALREVEAVRSALKDDIKSLQKG